MANEEPNKINIRVAMMRYLLKKFGEIASSGTPRNDDTGLDIIWRCLRYSEKDFIADILRAIVDSDELIFLSEAVNELSDDGELKCLRFTKRNVLADIA